MMRGAPERSVGELFAELATETTTLVRKEFELARAELRDNVSRATGGIVMLIAGAMIAILGVQALIACAILVLMRWVEPWQSALIVGVAVLVIGGILVAVGRARLDLGMLTPHRTLATLRRDTAWAKEQVHERV